MWPTAFKVPKLQRNDVGGPIGFICVACVNSLHYYALHITLLCGFVCGQALNLFGCHYEQAM